MLASPIPTSTPIDTGRYSIQIHRLGEDEGYFILQNTGGRDIQLSDFSVHMEKGQLLGTAWGVGWLTPDKCVVARKGKPSESSVPKGLECDFTGETVMVQKLQEVIFKDNVSVWLGEMKIGTCAHDVPVCSLP